MNNRKQPIDQTTLFITGTGTDIGKTVVCAILTEALQADYWKPVQAGYEQQTDSEWVRQVVTNSRSVVHPEGYKLKMPASPHIAAREEGVHITEENILKSVPQTDHTLIIEGAGGLMVPLNDDFFIADLAAGIGAKLILVSRNMLGSINHSLLTALACRQKNLPVLGWIFNDNYLAYEEEIVRWSGYPKLASIPYSPSPDARFISEQALLIRKQSASWIW